MSFLKNLFKRKKITTPRYFGIDPTSLTSIPEFYTELLEIIKESVPEEGIFRLGGDLERVARVQSLLEQSEPYYDAMLGLQIHSRIALLKRFFLRMTTPILEPVRSRLIAAVVGSRASFTPLPDIDTPSTFDALDGVPSVPRIDVVRGIWRVLSEMSPVIRQMLEDLFAVVAEFSTDEVISITHMDTKKLGTILCMTLLGAFSREDVGIIRHFILDHESIFGKEEPRGIEGEAFFESLSEDDILEEQKSVDLLSAEFLVIDSVIESIDYMISIDGEDFLVQILEDETPEEEGNVVGVYVKDGVTCKVEFAMEEVFEEEELTFVEEFVEDGEGS